MNLFNGLFIYCLFIGLDDVSFCYCVSEVLVLGYCLYGLLVVIFNGELVIVV